MKSVESRIACSETLTPDDQIVMRHVARHGMTTSHVWSFANEFDGLDQVAIGNSVRRLMEMKLLERGILHHGKFYFVPTAAATPYIGSTGCRVGLMGEPLKVLAFAKLLLLCRERPMLNSIPNEPFVKHFGESLRGISNRFLVNPNDRRSMSFFRIDTQLQSRSSRPAQHIRADLLRFAKHPLLASIMKQQLFEYIWITATKARAQAVVKTFGEYRRVGTFPFTALVMPELLPLLAGIKIEQEVFINAQKS